MKRLTALPIVLLLIILNLSFVRPANAECVPIYGGGESCTNPQLSIIKSVFNPASNAFVHDLGINDSRFHPGDKVSFQIKVTNNGSGKATHVVITDFLPSSLLAVAPNPDSITGPAGATITIQANSLNPGESSTFTVVGEVVASLPQSLMCQSNQAQATSNETTNPASDSSQFCVEQGVTPTSGLTVVTPTPTLPISTLTPAPTVFPPAQTQTLPPTGPEMLSYVIPIASGSLGIALKMVVKKMRVKS